MSKEATTVKTTIPVNICHPGADVQIRSVTNVWKCTKCGGVLVKVPPENITTTDGPKK